MHKRANEIDPVDRELIDNEHDGKPGEALSLERTLPPVVDAEDASREMQEAMAAATTAWVELFKTPDWGA